MFFKVTHKDAGTKARIGKLKTDHGTVETPVFMPVGTQGTVKSLSPEELLQSNTSIILNNAYHLYLRPGEELLDSIGGAHKFCGWDGPILTDSGGYQIYSLSNLNKTSDEGVQFQSHLDGSLHFFTPERIIDIQKKIGADIIMPLDKPIPYPSDKIDAQSANRLTIEWAKRSKESFENTKGYHNYKQVLFGILQGGVFTDLRKMAIEEMTELDFPGYAIGGLAVGEPKDLLFELTDFSTDFMPEDKPRYLMGIGKPEDIVESIGMGVDMFDCVLPTRVGRNGWIYTHAGRLVIKNAEFKDDLSAIDDSCNCYACKNFSRAYLRHLFNAGEMLGPRLASLHNITFYQKLIEEAKEAVRNNNYTHWKAKFLQNYNSETIKSGAELT
ncbi:tRNA guanosine(34) transglycosylase Tgt [candidate division KSB1 bacterium]|nr:tRNA guanosine(34) transglycosylase Tgt [candidate division KSB1 bacterium]